MTRLALCFLLMACSIAPVSAHVVREFSSCAAIAPQDKVIEDDAPPAKRVRAEPGLVDTDEDELPRVRIAKVSVFELAACVILSTGVLMLATLRWQRQISRSR